MNSIISRDEAAQFARQYRLSGKKVVLTNGCFDILHAGHVRYLKAARTLGDCLIVGLNSDSSVRRLKGPERPVNCEADRAEVLAALSAVDYVVIFEELTAENIVAVIQPAVYVKGGDYRVEDLPEAKTVAAYGGQVVLVPEVPGRSSSLIIGKIREGSGEI